MDERGHAVTTPRTTATSQEVEVEFTEPGFAKTVREKSSQVRFFTWTAIDAPPPVVHVRINNSDGYRRSDADSRAESPVNPVAPARVTARDRSTSAAFDSFRETSLNSKRDSGTQSNGSTVSTMKAPARFETEPLSSTKARPLPAFCVDQSDESPWADLPVHPAFDSTDELVAMEREADRLKKLDREQRGPAWNA
jgi:hypothetical protein